MAYFRRRTLVDALSTTGQRNTFLKSFTLILLGSSVSLFLANADLIINPQISNSIAYIKQFFVTSDGTSSGSVSVMLDTSGVFAKRYCNLSGNLCTTIEDMFGLDTQLSSINLQLTALSGLYLTGGQVDAKINVLSGTLNSLAKANLACTQNQLPQFSGGVWICGTIATVAETDPIFNDWHATSVEISHWNDAYGWGNHANVGYLTGEKDPKVGTLTSGKRCTSTNGTTITCSTNAPSLVESDPTILPAIKSIITGDITNWNSAYTNIHNHSNKSILDTVDGGRVAKWDTVYTWYATNPLSSYATTASLSIDAWDRASTFVAKANISDTLSIDDTNHRIGIGTATPNGKLDVKTSTDHHLLVRDSLNFADGISVYAVNEDNTDLKPMEFASSNYTILGGYVGIGVTSATERLEVAGKVKADEFCSSTYCLTLNIIRKLTLMLTDTANDINLLVQNITADFLKLTGSLQVGNSGDGCAVDNAGTIRFIGGNFEGCNGSSWNILSMSPVTAPVVLSCGSMDSHSYYSTQINSSSAGLCNGGSATSFVYSSTSNKWTWSCGSATCSANEIVDGACQISTKGCAKGYFDDTYGYECSVGGGTITWQCIGLNGGIAKGCSRTDSVNCPLGGCFVAGTLVTMADGSKKSIESIGTGETLLGGENSPNQIEKLFKIYYQRQLYSLNGGKYFVSDTHPFMTTEGWKSFYPAGTLKENPDLIVNLLQVGDVLVTDNGFERLVTVNSHIDPQYVYNFRTYGNHTYYADGYLVHNSYIKAMQ